MTEQMDLFEKPITIEELDAQVLKTVEQRAVYDAAKEESNKQHKIYQQEVDKLLQMMEACDKKSYKLDGVATISRKEKYVVPTPKSTRDKRAFFQWLQQKYDEESMWAYASVNSNTLNSLYNTLREEAEELGQELHVDGIDLPTTRVTLSIRKN